MSDDVKLLITGTFGIIAVIWVITNADNVGNLTQKLAGAYGTAVGSLRPAA
jgi:hypothetical protein